MISFFSAQTRCAALAIALLTMVGASGAVADKSPGYGAPEPYSHSYKSNFTPLKIPTLGYATPGLYRHRYTPPSHKPRTVVQKSFPVKTTHYRPAGHYAPPKRKSIKPQGDVGSRVVYVPVPQVQEKVITVAHPKPVKKTVRVSRYMVEKLHADRCIKNGPGDVYLQPSHLSEVLGNVLDGEKVHVTLCLTDDDMNRQWCALKNPKGIEAWLPAKHLQLCDW